MVGSMSIAPLRLRADNFTPATRTPWGGARIRQHFKAGLELSTGDAVVGESWEVSVEPSFPSRTEEGALLSSVIATAPQAWLGEAVAQRHGGQTPLLIKLLDAADNLSVQVHPADGDPALAADESGKPEAWLILHAEPGAGLLLGFRQGVQREDVVQCIARNGELDQLMCFVPVDPGEVFVIAAGTPHAIGAGITLLEAQLVQPGRRGLTYRYWDWNRRYDEQGRPAAAGQPRALHLDRSLEVTAWEGLRGERFVASCRRQPTILSSGTMVRTRLLEWEGLVAECWRGSGELALDAAGTMWALCCLDGTLRIDDGSRQLSLRRGQSAVVPAAAGALSLRGQATETIAIRSHC